MRRSSLVIARIIEYISLSLAYTALTNPIILSIGAGVSVSRGIRVFSLIIPLLSSIAIYYAVSISRVLRLTSPRDS